MTSNSTILSFILAALLLSGCSDSKKLDDIKPESGNHPTTGESNKPDNDTNTQEPEGDNSGTIPPTPEEPKPEEPKPEEPTPEEPAAPSINVDVTDVTLSDKPLNPEDPESPVFPAPDISWEAGYEDNGTDGGTGSGEAPTFEATVCLESSTGACIELMPPTTESPIVVTPSDLLENLTDNPLDILDSIGPMTGELPFYVEVTDTSNGNTEKSPTQHLPVDILNAFINKIEKALPLLDEHFFAIDLAMNNAGNTIAASSWFYSGGPNPTGKATVQVYQKNTDQWTSVASFDGSGAVDFGVQLALNSTGNVLAIGNTNGHGDVRVFTASGSTWSTSYTLLDPSNLTTDDTYGAVVALSGDGNMVVSALKYKDTSKGSQVITHINTEPTWVPTTLASGEEIEPKPASIASNIPAEAKAISLNEDGTVLAIAYGIMKTEADDTPPPPTEIYISEGDGNWTNPQSMTVTGSKVSLDADGNTLAVIHDAGVSIFENTNNTWGAEQSIEGITAATDIALSRDGATLVIGNETDASNAVGYNGTETAQDQANSGAVYVFAKLADGTWQQQHSLKALEPVVGEKLGGNIAISGEANRIVSSAAGNQATQSVYVF